eukprot:CAMPEP_0114434862 /NCGR_PEP_ID=MMETSP0103-20121206/12499_1 /TAXON_ID=37642 ORGANISM="Paraphysomonas imperforata, Strain PA2" /NCGR_SAMPLE_ID=MMETSP0103 /ASSEMBLY_ACC=CAM_ASM_000201 /LENGTH=482 /DNA_ID=CAMNT_0001604801 /DNA_START=516 /DNA_END=1967 /DNA_ORIENTATION=-
MIVIIISCVGYIAATGAKTTPSTCDNPACENDPNLCPSSMICEPEENPVYELIETVCIAFFTFDYFVRLFLVPLMPARLAGIIPNYFDILNANAIMPTPTYSVGTTIWRYMTIPMNVIDLVAILPFYVAYFSTSGSSVSIIRILRLVRVLRVFKIGGMGNGMTLMSNAMMNSLSAMGILLFFTVLGVILFGSIIFFLEAGKFTVNDDFPEGAFLRWDVLHSGKEESPFSSILVSCYWAMVTFTTVGYGDLVPTSPTGRFVALVLMYTGILVLALPISVIGANFQREYERLNNVEEYNEEEAAGGTSIWDSALDDDDPTTPSRSSAPPKRGLLRSISSSATSSAAPRRPSTELQVERIVKKVMARERSQSMTSTLPDEIAEAMIPVNEQLKQLTTVCEQLMNRIDDLQSQQKKLLSNQLDNGNGEGGDKTECDDKTEGGGDRNEGAEEDTGSLSTNENGVVSGTGDNATDGIQLNALKVSMQI